MVRAGLSGVSICNCRQQARFCAATSLWFRYNDVLQRCKELDAWTQDLSLPSVVWLSGLFNPQSFLTGDAGRCSTATETVAKHRYN